MSMFNAGQGNAERMAEYGAQNQANAANASAFNNALAQDAQSQNNYDMSKAAGQTQAESNQYGQANDLVNISTNELNNMNQSNDANSQIVAQGNAAQGTQNRNNKVLDVLDPLGIRKVFSDKRLKKNIEKIGTSKSGLNIYSFEYKNSDFGNGVYQGVMSDEIPSHAVVKEEDIYDMVDYSKIDVEFKLITN
jgi:tRNA nucleotidyltransferase (CCA-adding enzyme)